LYKTEEEKRVCGGYRALSLSMCVPIYPCPALAWSVDCPLSMGGIEEKYKGFKRNIIGISGRFEELSM
jgi:hypothetical protein